MKAVITGASKGIGRAIAELFVSKGFDLFICARNPEGLASTKSALEKQHPGRKVYTKSADLSKKEEVMAFAEAVKAEWAYFDVLINNTGVFLPGSILNEPEGNLEFMMQTNLFSAYTLTRSLLTNIKNGHIFNMCSIASLAAYPNGGSYSISKFALLGFSKVLREELKDRAIRVTAVLPGATWSASWEGVDLPEKRLMKAEDIAKAVWGAYELSDQAVMEELIIRPQLGDL
ncbi:MAG: SDR family oxidoreductase [Bacteroidota bacterium]